MEKLLMVGVALLLVGTVVLTIRGNKKRKFKKSNKLHGEYTGDQPNELGAA